MAYTIIMVTNNYTPYSGGVVSSLQVSCDELRRQGHRVIIVTLDFLGDGIQEEDLIRVPCRFRFRYRGNCMAIPWFAERYLKQLFDQYQPDIIHVHHPFLLGVWAQRIARTKGIPVLFTYHTRYEQYLHYVPLPALCMRPLLTRWVDYFCTQVDAVIAPTASLTNTLACARERVHVVPSGIRPCFVPSGLYKKLRSSEIIELVCVCRFAPEKNIIALLELMQQLGSGYRLTLLGYGQQQKFLEQYAYGFLQLPRDRVNFIIKPTRETIALWYQKADLFIFASQSETQGLVLAEAMAAGTPVIALRGPGIVDIVVDGKNGYCVSSVGAMAEKIDHVMNNPAELAHLQEGAFATSQAYSPAQTTRKLVAVYANLLTEAR
jgi:1,2-diacylglycerol 3-alpha-glucosyltransferase